MNRQRPLNQTIPKNQYDWKFWKEITIFTLIQLSCFTLIIFLLYLCYLGIGRLNLEARDKFIELYNTNFNSKYDMISSLYLLDSPECLFTMNECKKLYPFYETNASLLGSIFKYFANTKEFEVKGIKYKNLLNVILQKKAKEYKKRQYISITMKKKTIAMNLSVL